MDRNETEPLLKFITEAGANQGLHEKDILSRAGLGRTTLSKIKSAGDTKISTLSRMANVVGLRLALVPHNPALDQLLNRNLFAGKPSARP
jgi:DNA-binding phage protein